MLGGPEVPSAARIALEEKSIAVLRAYRKRRSPTGQSRLPERPPNRQSRQPRMPPAHSPQRQHPAQDGPGVSRPGCPAEPGYVEGSAARTRLIEPAVARVRRPRQAGPTQARLSPPVSAGPATVLAGLSAVGGTAAAFTALVPPNSIVPDSRARAVPGAGDLSWRVAREVRSAGSGRTVS